MNSQNKRIWFTCGLVFSAIMLVVLISFYVTSNTVSTQLDNRVYDYATITEDLIEDELRSSEDMLRVTSGWLNTNPSSVTSEDWAEFIEQSGVVERYSGIEGVGYSSIVKNSQIEEVESSQNITIFPNDGNEVLSPVFYVFPNNEAYNNIRGYDMYSDEQRREAMFKARDTNSAHLTGPIPLLVDSSMGEEENLGFIMHVPRYKIGPETDTLEKRRESIIGYIHAGYQTEDFFASALSNQLDDRFSYQLYVGGDLLYEEPGFHDKLLGEFEEKTITASFSGIDFDIKYAYLPEDILSSSVRSQPLSVLIIGITGATLATYLTWLLMSNRNKELLLEKEREINEAKDSLLSIASHQLRTPATGVKQYLGMVLHGMAGDVTERQKNFLEKAYESNERQLKTINDVLYLARLEAGRITLSKTKILMRAIIQSLVEEMHESIEENSHKVKLKAPKKPVYIWADEHMVRMILENLLSNAIKYTPEKGKIDVILKKASDGIVVLIKDSGVGIQEDQKEEIFKQFSRASNSLSKSVSGSGIGLYLVKNLVELHDGSITVESDGKNGSTFTLYLPTNKPSKKDNL